MARPVRELLRLVHVEQIDLQKIRREDMEVLEYLRSEDPEQLKNLRKLSKANNPDSGADLMIERGWIGFDVSWMQDRISQGTGPPQGMSELDRALYGDNVHTIEAQANARR